MMDDLVADGAGVSSKWSRSFAVSELFFSSLFQERPWKNGAAFPEDQRVFCRACAGNRRSIPAVAETHDTLPAERRLNESGII